MRRIDKKLNMMKVNLLAESRYLESKGLVKESADVIEFIKLEAKKLNETMLPITDNYGDPKMAFAENEDELEEGFFKNTIKKVKDFGNRVLDIPSKEEEAKKQQAIQEIIVFNFESLFFQPSVYKDKDGNEKMEITPEVIKELRNRVVKAGNEMPTVKELIPILFKINDKVSNATMIIGGGLRRGIIPNCFESIRDVNDKISNDEAIKRTIGYLG